MKTVTLVTALITTALVVFVAVWFFFFRTTIPTQTNTNTTTGLNGDSTQTVTVTPSNPTANDNGQTPIQSQTATQTIFQVATGPVVGATLIQTFNPTTTVARYVSQENGHVFDLVLDSSGSLAKIVSNTTIPGAYRAVWEEKGNAVILQYLENSIVKTVYLGFGSTTNKVTRVQFLPDGILDIAASPDTKSVSYLLRSNSGVDGYIANSNGTASKKLFSLALSQVLLSWPSANTLLVQTKSAAGMAGIVFSVDVTNGNTSPLIYAPGLTATADRTFTHVIYQTASADMPIRSSYSHDVKNGTNSELTFAPYPEKCIWSAATSTVMLCAIPLKFEDPSYLDLWHIGAASDADSIFAFDIKSGASILVVSPGSGDGGALADIYEMAASPDNHYLLYTTKGDRSLWGVRLSR